MCFDDTIKTLKMVENAEKQIRDIIYNYIEPSELTEDNLTRWESKCYYNGYSISFHMLYPLIYGLYYRTTQLTTDPNGVEDFEYDMSEKEISHIKFITRNKLFEIIRSIRYNRDDWH